MLYIQEILAGRYHHKFAGPGHTARVFKKKSPPDKTAKLADIFDGFEALD